MTVIMEVLAVETYGDYVDVKLQGSSKNWADWRPMLSWRIQVPEHIGRTYRIGQRVKFKVTR